MANIVTRILNAVEREAFHRRMALEGEGQLGWSQHFHHTNTAEAMARIAAEAPKVHELYATEIAQQRAAGIASAESTILKS